jgi:hypothetical protein
MSIGLDFNENNNISIGRNLRRIFIILLQGSKTENRARAPRSTTTHCCMGLRADQVNFCVVVLLLLTGRYGQIR